MAIREGWDDVDGATATATGKVGEPRRWGNSHGHREGEENVDGAWATTAGRYEGRDVDGAQATAIGRGM